MRLLKSRCGQRLSDVSSGVGPQQVAQGPRPLFAFSGGKARLGLSKTSSDPP